MRQDADNQILARVITEEQNFHRNKRNILTKDFQMRKELFQKSWVMGGNNEEF